MIDDYFLPADNLEAQVLLSDWRWLIGDKGKSVVAVAAVGNLFLKAESGRVFILEIEDGTCQCIAESVEDFQ